jgi:uncharacterized damage-inducible protein DinB
LDGNDGLGECRIMNSQTSVSRSDVEHAEALIRALIAGDFGTRAAADAKSLARMLVHLVRIQTAISASPERHANAAKRLQDFSVVTWRMTARNPDAAEDLTRITHALRTAGLRLKEALDSEQSLTAV